MKKIIYIFLIFNLQFVICNLHAQWVTQYNPTSVNLQDITFINNNTGWVCSEGGQILKTTNGGINWILQNSGVSGKILTGIHAVDSLYVYCVGWWQTILKTTDGGNNWIVIRNGPQPPPQVGSFYGLYFLNRNTGWMLRNEYVLKTTNAGLSFDSAFINESYIRDVYFKDAINGVMCADAAQIFKSTDGGITWNFITIPQTTTESPDFYKVSFIGNTGWVVGAGTNVPGLGPLTWRTTNFGSTWDTIGRVPYPYTHLNYCVFFSSLNIGWCGGSYGHIFKTTNGGFNWIEQVVPSNYFRRSMWFYNDSIGWAVGGFGQILHTTNGGTYVNVQQISSELPGEFKLYQNNPNPFNPISVIKYSIPKSGNVTIKIYNLLGEEIAVLLNDKYKSPGKYRIEFDGTNYPSGVYFYKLESGEFVSAKKMVLIK